ncbi:alpha/beta hydrolase fold domain-containing protein [Glycomyces sp. NPDC048151]|uniref:alpha/beta hydrolase fold domain-containing protein n=1 Tax=Glycomyces sp. NPDC048151 TaxID=3364002 RepID=UPI00371C0A78
MNARETTATIDAPQRHPLAARLLAGTGRVIAWTVAALTVLLGFAYFAAPVPLGPAEDAVSVTAMLVPWMTAVLIAFGLIGIATAALTWKRRKALAAAGALTAAAAALMVVMPWAATSRVADVSLAASFDAAPTTAPDATETYATVDGEALKVDVYLPEDAEDPVPTVVYVHGGGWSGGSRDESAPWQRWIADQGYAVYSIDYRLAPPPRWQDAVGDVKCAIGWVRDHAAAHGADPASVNLVGDSAGGHLAMMAAYTVGDPEFAPSCEAEEAPVTSVMTWFAPTDLTTLEADSDMPASADGYLTDFLGATLEDEPGRYETASPLTHAGSGLPPTMIVQAEADRLVPMAQGRALADALTGAGVPVTELDLPWAHHGFTGQWGGWASQALRPAVAAFLEAHAG